MVEQQEAPITIGYWKIRGLLTHITHVCEFAGVKYNMEFYEQGEGPEFCREAWLSVKKQDRGYDFPNLPYMQDGDLKITETMAIIRYVCNKFADF